MAFQDDRAAWVNKSGIVIPVYQGYGDFGAGQVTAGGTQIGTIYHDEMYTSLGRDGYRTYFEIKFRNSRGRLDTGYIETKPQGAMHPQATWVNGQEPFHYYNSNGSWLSPNSSGPYIFTVKKSVNYKRPSGTSLGNLPIGAQLKTNGSNIGESYPHYMYFTQVKLPGSSSWTSLYNGGGAYVDLGFHLGSSPNNRALW